MKKLRCLKEIKRRVPGGFQEQLLGLAVLLLIRQLALEDLKVIPNTKALHMKAFQAWRLLHTLEKYLYDRWANRLNSSPGSRLHSGLVFTPLTAGGAQKAARSFHLGIHLAQRSPQWPSWHLLHAHLDQAAQTAGTSEQHYPTAAISRLADSPCWAGGGRLRENSTQTAVICASSPTRTQLAPEPEKPSFCDFLLGKIHLADTENNGEI